MHLGKIYKRVKKGLGIGPAPLPHKWRTVEQGPLAGLEFYLPEGERARWADRFLVGGYEAEMLAALDDLAKSKSILYDIGAHIGFYTCAWLHLGGARVEAFEPASYNREILTATIERNNLTGKVSIHSAALGDKDSIGTLISSMTDVGAASAAYVRELGRVELPEQTRQRALPGLVQTSVTVRQLDRFYTEAKLDVPCVLKVDVEGAEAGVLAGAIALIEEHKPAILCEVHNARNEAAITRMLAPMGYELVVLGKNGVHPACLWRINT